MFNLYISSVFVGLIVLIHNIRRYFQGCQFKKLIRTNKVVIITGCNTGIGKETALELARRGCTVYMACRNYQECESARKEIIAKTGNINIINCKLDLSSFESIRQFVRRFKEKENYLDVLINNAGVCGIPNRTLTIDGMETTFAVNYLGHFLLTNLLLNTLKLSAAAKIINVSSCVHAWGNIEKNNLNSEIDYDGARAYNNSKLAQILFTKELAKRLQNTGITVNALHPGVVRTNLSKHLSLSIKILFKVAYIMFKSPKSGAQTTIALTLDPAFDNITGKYFKECKLSVESTVAKNDEMAKWLWLKSEELTNII